ncbi:hypothetical protein MPSEU_000388700 [Mayamaea pseudoterrestris]|nr:hypothetical protein MPSEU_000388700 [Mayamaea pseudoterrestris]
MTVVRGIINSSGTGCHISSALVVFCHCLSPLRRALALRKNSVTDPSWLTSLSSFCRVYCNDSSSDESAIDPTELYEALRRDIGLNHRLLGDAVTALAKILQELRSLADPTLNNVFAMTLDGGQAHFLIEGTRDDEIICSKQTKKRAISCPFSLSTDYDSIQAAFNAKLENTAVDGYQWAASDANEHDQGDVPLTTTKMLVLDSLPNVWLFHLDRRIPTKTQNNFETDGMLITSTLVMQHDGKDYEYQLRGGILHVIDLDCDPDELVEEGDHNAALVRTDIGHWIFVDDEHTVEISSDDEAVELLGGSHSSLVEKNRFMQGTLLVYQSVEFPNDDVEEILASLQSANEVLSVVSKDPQDLVGRRLSIQWSNGQWYQGHVAAFNVMSGKHRVEYDDGDLREYNLQKKTIEWL